MQSVFRSKSKPCSLIHLFQCATVKYGLLSVKRFERHENVKNYEALLQVKTETKQSLDVSEMSPELLGKYIFFSK